MVVMPLLGFDFSVYLVLIDCSGRVGLPSYLVGVVRENRGRGYFWGASHEGPSKFDKEKKGKEKDRRSGSRCKSKRGVETHQSAMPRLRIEPGVQYFWHTV